MPGLTYAEVGATLGRLPAGYRHLDVRRRLGAGVEVFERAAADVLGWRLQRAAGFRVHPSTPTIRVGTRVRLAPGPRVLPGARLLGPLGAGWRCEVVAVVSEPHRAGFAYGTLPGHPETGEELFLVVHDPATGEVSLHVRAFSRPSSAVSRLLDPALRVGQRVITRRYLRALDDGAAPLTRGVRRRRLVG